MMDIPDRIASAILATPWAITEEGLQQIITVASREGDVSAVAMRQSERLPATSRAGFRDGVATLNLVGPVMRYASLFTEISGATSLQVFASDLQAAIDNPDVKAILLNVDSPGGMAAGIAETAAAIRASPKPVWAYIDDLGASASYWLPSGASRIVASRTAMVGSIGVVLSARKSKDANTIEIVSSRAPNKRVDIATDEGRAQAQRVVDQLESVFISDVAKYRGKTEEFVTESFGQGGLVFAPDALAAGMVDAISSYEQTLAELVRAISGTSRKRTTKMTTENGGAADPVMFTQEQLNAAIAGARNEENAKVSAAVESAVTAERQRIAGIQALARPGFEKFIAEGVENGSAVADVALAIMTEAASRGISIESIKKDSPDPAAHAAPPADDGKPKGKAWADIVGAKTSRM